jgi:hypothetical protein
MHLDMKNDHWKTIITRVHDMTENLSKDQVRMKYEKRFNEFSERMNY